MNTVKTKILFISHEANHSGAPIILLNTIKWLSQNSDYELSVLFQRDGHMINEFSKYTKTIYKYFNIRHKSRSISARIYNKYFLPIDLKNVIKQIHGAKYDIIFANSIASNYFIKNFAKKGDSKIIANILELEFTFHVFKITVNSGIIKNSDLYICMNKAVSDNLISSLKVNPDSIKILHPITEYQEKKVDKKVINEKFKIPADAIIIGASGTVEWRKGADLFIRLALIYKNKYGMDNIYFVWTGNFINETEKYKIEHDINKAGLQGKVLFVGEIIEVIDYYSSFDIFTLMSREEALGIVCIENMALGNPVICFEKCGGMEEVADRGAAIKVPYLNIEAMADEINGLILDKEKYLLSSRKSIDYVKDEYDKDKLGKEYIKIFTELLEH